MISEEQYDVLRQQINDSLQKASAYREKLRGAQARYAVASIVLGGLSTLVAGLSAVMGEPLVLDNWPLTCAIAAVLAFGVTVVSGLQRQLADPASLSEASECVGRLRALRVDVIGPAYDLEEVRKKYQQIVVDFPRIDF